MPSLTLKWRLSVSVSLSGEKLHHLEANLAAGDGLAIRVAGDHDLPDVLAAARVNGLARRVQAAVAVAPQVIRRIRDPHHAPLAARPCRHARAAARHVLDDRAVDAAVDDAVGLVVTGTWLEARDDTLRRRFDQLQTDRVAPGVLDRFGRGILILGSLLHGAAHPRNYQRGIQPAT